MSEISQKPTSMDIETTFECPRCHKELPVANQLTHDVACARMHRDTQRAPETQPNVRQSSSGGNAQQRTQPIPRREDRRVGEIAEDKLITCPNCEKSVREQDMDSHMDNECLKSEMIPCEFCEKGIPMSNYNQHIESCQRRAQRDRSPIRERMVTEPSQQQRQQQGRGGRDISPQRGSNQGGGIGGFLRNIGSAANQLLGLTPESQQQREQREQRERALQEERRHEEERQREFLEHMFGQPEAPRNLPQSNQNTMFQYSGGPAGGQTVIRTVESGPGGVIVRSRVIPANNQMYQQPPNAQPMEVYPLGLLLGMMGGGFGGLIPLGNGEFEIGPTAEEQGLDKETIDSLALIKYNKEANKNLSEDLKKCPICLDDFEDGQEVRFLWCTHRFHKGCVDHWLEHHTTCPICKKDFSEAEHGYSP